MALVAAAACPHPPLLVPGVGAGASGELDGLRDACDAAVAELAAAEPDLVVAVGAAPVLGPAPEGAWGTLAGYGVQVPVGAGTGAATLPLSLTMARWLLDRGEVTSASLLFGVEADAASERCRAVGEALAGRAAGHGRGGRPGGRSFPGGPPAPAAASRGRATSTPTPSRSTPRWRPPC